MISGHWRCRSYSGGPHGSPPYDNICKLRHLTKKLSLSRPASYEGQWCTWCVKEVSLHLISPLLPHVCGRRLNKWDHVCSPICVDTLRIPPPAFNPCGQGCEGDARNPAASVYLLCLSLLSERNKSRVGDTAWGPRVHPWSFPPSSPYTNPHCSPTTSTILILQSFPCTRHFSEELKIACHTAKADSSAQGANQVNCNSINQWETYPSILTVRGIITTTID